MIIWLTFVGMGIFVYFILRRTRQAFQELGSRRNPEFFYTNLKSEMLGVPVFTYHSIAERSTPDSITPIEFEEHMRYLAENGYNALCADELYGYLVDGNSIPNKSVVITFDDGRATLWTVAYPIIKKYGFKIISFVIPDAMSGSGVRPTLDDYEDGKPITLTELLNADLSNMPSITWDEAKIMHDSDLVDFQSHTLNHSLIFYTPEIVDFINPDYDFGYNNYSIPIMRYEDVDQLYQRPHLGTPIYRYKSRMSAAKRFFDDEELRKACVDYVKIHGGEEFFYQSEWREKLYHFVEMYRRQHNSRGYFETQQEQKRTIQYSLVHSKSLIEEHLPGNTVRHLCYPWHRYSALATYLSRESGYVTNFIDINPQKPMPDWNDPYYIQRKLPINEYGDDPYQITRIGAEGNMILSLPGKGRLSYHHRFISRFMKVPRFIERLLDENTGLD